MICSKCKLDKEESDFALDPTRKRGRNYWCRLCTNERNRMYYRKSTEKVKQRYLKRTYDLSPDEYITLFEKQQNRCEICGEYKPLCIDHNHKTGSFRGLLCQNCNRGLGMFRDEPGILMKASEYLEGAI